MLPSPPTISSMGILERRKVISKELSCELNEIASTIFSLDPQFDEPEKSGPKLLDMIIEKRKKKIPR